MTVYRINPDSGMAAAISHSVLLLQNNEPGRQWTLNVQETPTPAITLRGVEPTLEEVARVLATTGAPAWMCFVVMVMARVATPVEE